MKLKSKLVNNLNLKLQSKSKSLSTFKIAAVQQKRSEIKTMFKTLTDYATVFSTRRNFEWGLNNYNSTVIKNPTDAKLQLKIKQFK